MKYAYQAATFVAGLAAAAPALAQSNVTIYGVVDASVTYTSNINGSSRESLDGGKRWANMLGFKGREDLGDGAAALYQIEFGVTLDTGTTYSRPMFVGLTDARYGTLTLGKQYDLLLDSTSLTTAIFNVNTAIHPGDYDRSAGVTLNKLVKYKSPLFSGVQFGVMYSFGNPVAPTTNLGRAFAVDATYAGGPIRLALIYESINGYNVTPATDIGIAHLWGQTFSAATPLTVTLDHNNIVALNGEYKVGNWKVVGGYSASALAAYGTSATLKNYDIGAAYNPTTEVTLAAGVSHSSMEQSTWNIFNAVAAYNFSKRTDVFVSAVSEKAAGPDQHAALFMTGPSSTNRQTVARVGIRHFF